jgi:hypothetical protein
LSFVLFLLPLAAQDTIVLRAPTPVAAPDPLSPEIRAQRDTMFAVYHLDNFRPLSSEPAGMPPRFTHHDRRKLSELPVEPADAIVVGDVSIITSRMTSNERGIYSEYAVAIDKFLKLPAGFMAQPPQSIDVLQIGGAVTSQDGRIYRYLDNGVGLEIEAGNRYLMFLKYTPTGNCFVFVKVWQIINGVATAVANDDIARVKMGTSTVNGMAESAVLMKILTLVGQGGQ